MSISNSFAWTGAAACTGDHQAGVAAYTVVLVTPAEEVDQARVKMTGSGFHTASLLGISAGSRKENDDGAKHPARCSAG
jgi:hypothetical protein